MVTNPLSLRCSLPGSFRAALGSCALALSALLASAAAQAAPLSFFVPYTGQGNVSVFDATVGTGGWVGSIDEFPDPAVSDPLSLVSVVLFTVDEFSNTLTGSFEFTTTDLLNTLFGTLTGSYLEEDILTAGGQFSIDYLLLGGSGRFAGASGFGLAFVDYMPLAAGGNNYSESGLLVFDVPMPMLVPMLVPEPATLALVLAGLLAVGSSRRSSSATSSAS